MLYRDRLHCGLTSLIGLSLMPMLSHTQRLFTLAFDLLSSVMLVMPRKFSQQSCRNVSTLITPTSVCIGFVSFDEVVKHTVPANGPQVGHSVKCLCTENNSQIGHLLATAVHFSDNQMVESNNVTSPTFAILGKRDKRFEGMYPVIF